MKNEDHDRGVPTMEWTTETGMKCSVYRRRNTSVFSAQLWFTTGGIDEEKDEEGLAHFAEHMLFKLWSGESDLHAQIASLGGEIGAQTSHDWTQVHLLVPGENWQKALELLIHMLSWRAPNIAAFEKEKKVVVEELRVSGTDPVRSITHDLLRAAFGAQPYGRPVAGTPASVDGFTIEQLMRFMERGYGTIRAHLMAAGQIPVEDVRRYIEEIQPTPLHPGVKRTKRRWIDPSPSPSEAPLSVASDGPTLIALGYRTGALSAMDRLAVNVMCALMGHGEGGLLRKQAAPGGRMEHLVAGGTLSPFLARKNGLVSLIAQPHPGKELEAVRELSSLMESALDHVTIGHVSQAFMNMEIERRYDSESIHRWLSLRGQIRMEISEREFHPESVDLRELFEAVQRVSRNVLSASGRHMVMHGPVFDPQKWKKDISSGAYTLPKPHTPLSQPGSIRSPLRAGLKVIKLRSEGTVVVDVRPDTDVLSSVMMIPTGIGREHRSGFGTVLATIMSGESIPSHPHQRMFQANGGAMTGFARLDSIGLQCISQGGAIESGLRSFLEACLPTLPSPEVVRTAWARQASLHSNSWDSGMDLAERAFREKLFGFEHPYSKQGTVVGALEDDADVHLFLEYADHVWSNHTPVYAFTGPVSPSEIAEKMATYGAQSAQSFSPLEVPGPLLSGRADQMLKSLDGSAGVFIGGAGLSSTDPKYAVLEVFCASMGAFHGPLSQQLRGDLGEVYALRADCSGGEYRGAWWIQAACAPAMVGRVHDIVEATLEDPMRWLTPALIQQSCALLWGRYHMMHEVSLNRAMSLARTLASGGSCESIQSAAARYRDVTFDDVSRLVSELVLNGSRVHIQLTP